MTSNEKVVFETKEEKNVSIVQSDKITPAGKYDGVTSNKLSDKLDETPPVADGADNGAEASDNTAKTDGAAVPNDDTKRDAAEDGAAKLDKKNSGYTDRDILEIILDNKDDEKEEVPDGIVKLSKPVSFDGQIIETLDLRELKNISQKKAKKIRKVYNKIAENFTVSPESTEEYAMAAASVITKLPVELFEQLPHKDIVKIRTRVINFFFLD